MSKTKIEWSEYSWNPVTGCSKVSEGCRFCFAERMARRLAGRHGYPKAPHHFDVTLRPDRLDAPLRRKKPTMYFVCSMSDLFHKDVPRRFISNVFEVINQSPRHVYQILTKRPQRMLEYILWWEKIEGCSFDLENAWLGVSVENQAAADERREHLKRCPAAVKFVSYEPTLGPIDWTGWEFVSQIISGGESGPGARPSHPDWHRATRDFCQKHDIAYFFKQHGAWLPFGQKHVAWNAKSAEYFQILADRLNGTNRHLVLADNSGRQDFYRVGKKRAGHLLDGRTWQEFPR